MPACDSRAQIALPSMLEVAQLEGELAAYGTAQSPAACKRSARKSPALGRRNSGGSRTGATRNRGLPAATCNLGALKARIVASTQEHGFLRDSKA